MKYRFPMNNNSNSPLSGCDIPQYRMTSDINESVRDIPQCRIKPNINESVRDIPQCRKPMDDDWNHGDHGDNWDCRLWGHHDNVLTYIISDNAFGNYSVGDNAFGNHSVSDNAHCRLRNDAILLHIIHGLRNEFTRKYGSNQICRRELIGQLN